MGIVIPERGDETLINLMIAAISNIRIANITVYDRLSDEADIRFKNSLFIILLIAFVLLNEIQNILFHIYLFQLRTDLFYIVLLISNTTGFKDQYLHDAFLDHLHSFHLLLLKDGHDL